MAAKVKRKSAAVLLFSMTLALALFPGQRAVESVKLEVNLRNLKQQRSYRLKDSVLLDIQIVNSGAAAVGVFAKLGMGYQGGIILHVLDVAGNEIQPPTLEHDFLDGPAMQDPTNYFNLQPHQFFGTRQEFLISELVSRPGSYKLLAEYHCPVSTKSGKVGNFWSIERTSIVSKEIDLTVQ